jgi:16S rRNA (cytosine1402-N4)-methyltransferase
MVKRAFRAKEGMRVITKKVVRPTREEAVENPRSRSARLRCIEKL